MADDFDDWTPARACPDQSAVRGTGPVRYCDRCQSAVVNVSAMTREDARRFRQITGNRPLCVEATVEGDRALHVDGRHRWAAWRLVVGLGVGGLALAGCGSGGSEGVEQTAPVIRLDSSVADAVRAASTMTVPQDPERFPSAAVPDPLRADGTPAGHQPRRRRLMGTPLRRSKRHQSMGLMMLE